MDRTDSRRLDAEICKGTKLNLLYYKSVSIQVKGLIYHANMTKTPYKKQYPTGRFSNIDFVLYAKKAMMVIERLEPEQLSQSKLSKSDLLTQLFSELWKVVFQAGHSQLY